MRPLPFVLFAGFVVAALAPSFRDWKDADDDGRKEIILYYSVAGALFLYVGRKL